MRRGEGGEGPAVGCDHMEATKDVREVVPLQGSREAMGIPQTGPPTVRPPERYWPRCSGWMDET